MAGGADERDPGLDAVVPFTFACHRCGNCCTVGEGHVWLADGEPERLAAALGLAPEAFARRYLLRVSDPAGGGQRLSLREDPDGPPGNGRCALLDGGRRCTVYSARPEHCRSFPYWAGILGEPEAFERARAVCPGIAPVVPPERAAPAFAALEELYREVASRLAASGPVCERSGRCCVFEDAGHQLYATGLEADYCASRHPQAPPPEAEGRCPYHVRGACTAREGRPLGCRTYFCDERHTEALESLHEELLARLRTIERAGPYPAAYGRFPALIAARGVGTVPTRNSPDRIKTQPGDPPASNPT